MQLELEIVDAVRRPAVFRLAFLSATDRHLLQYPHCRGLRFNSDNGNRPVEWTMHTLTTGPLDDFVLNTHSRIAFDLYANINPTSKMESPWNIYLPNGDYSVKYVYHIDRDTDWYDFLAKRSRFAEMTPIWRGTLESNTISISITDGTKSTAK